MQKNSIVSPIQVINRTIEQSEMRDNSSNCTSTKHGRACRGLQLITTEHFTEAQKEDNQLN